MNNKKIEIMLAWLLAIEAIRFVDVTIAGPIYETIKKHKRNSDLKLQRELRGRKPVIGFVGKYDSDEKL